MQRIIAGIALFLALAAPTPAAVRPTHALIQQGQTLYAGDEKISSGQDMGPWRLVPLMFDPQATYTSAPANVDDSRQWRAQVEGSTLRLGTDKLALSIIVNGKATELVRDASITKAIVFRAVQTEVQAQLYPNAIRLRLRYTLQPGDKIRDLALAISGVAGQGVAQNLDRGGPWGGRARGQLESGAPLHALVVDARERYPRGYALREGTLMLFGHLSDAPKDVSKAGLVDLKAFHTGELTTSLPPEYVSMLTNDPDVSQAAKEISVENQVQQQTRFSLGLDCWIANESIEPASPLVFLDGYQSPVWSQIKPGSGNAGLQAVEGRLLKMNQQWLADPRAPRGALLYGDSPERYNSMYRVRGGNLHYFQDTAAWHAFLRTGRREWYNLARVLSAHVRDSLWLDGSQSHHKGLTPWSGAYSINDHATNPEGILFSYLCDGDYLALEQYQRWQAAYVVPTVPSRESCVSVRMCDVAYWFTGEPKWKTYSEQMTARLLTEIDRVKATPEWQKYRSGMPTGIDWHPLWHKQPLGLGADNQLPAGLINVADMVAGGTLDSALPQMFYGGDVPDGAQPGMGPNGEGNLNLQMPQVYAYFHGKPVQAPKHRIVYGTSKDGRARVVINKSDNEPSTLRIALGSRGGDIPGTLVEVNGPGGQHTTHFDYRVDESVRFPRYPLTLEVQGWIDGWPVVQKSIPFEGPAGLYQVEVFGHPWIMLHGPLSKYPERQDCRGEFAYPGQDASGKWPLGGVMVGNR